MCAVLTFLVGVVDYAMEKQLLKETLIRHAEFVDVQQRAECGMEDIVYFLER